MTGNAVPFDVDGSVILDANGRGSIRLAPQGEKWQVTRTRVDCSTRVNESEARWYLRQIAPRNIIDGTSSGSTGDTSDTVAYLEDGQAMFIEWTGGDAGATAVVTVSGWRSPPEGGFRAIH